MAIIPVSKTINVTTPNTEIHCILCVYLWYNSSSSSFSNLNLFHGWDRDAFTAWSIFICVTYNIMSLSSIPNSWSIMNVQLVEKKNARYWKYKKKKKINEGTLRKCICEKKINIFFLRKCAGMQSENRFLSFMQSQFHVI